MRASPLRLALPALVAVHLCAASAAAQTDRSFSTDDFSAYRFYVAPGPGNFVMVDGGDVGADLTPSFGATLGYLHRPYAADDLDWYIACSRGLTPSEGPCGDPPQPTTEHDFLGPTLALQLYGAFTFLERVQVGLNLPVLLYADGENYEFVEGTGRDLRSRVASVGGPVGGLLDPRISAKVRILDPDADGDGFVLSAGAWLQVPIAHYMWDRHFLGDDTPQAGGHVIAGFRYDALRIALNVGGTFRAERVNIRSHVGPELYWGLAAAYRVHPVVEVMAEFTGSTSFGQRFDSEAPMEVRGAGVLHLGEISVHAGAGAGLLHGIGVPVFHAFAGAQYAPAPDPDSDGDGLLDSLDPCPADAEDVDGWEDDDGCPDPDNDRDGIADQLDSCPDEAEDVDGFEDEDGCPDPDNDGDGISDGYDSCPDTPEDMDGHLDHDGCPDLDTDGDGIDDADDQCPNEAEDFDGFADEDGCPEEDVDGDGVPDDVDECPDEAEDMDGFQDEDGCPEEGPRRRGGR